MLDNELGAFGDATNKQSKRAGKGKDKGKGLRPRGKGKGGLSTITNNLAGSEIRQQKKGAEKKAMRHSLRRAKTHVKSSSTKAKKIAVLDEALEVEHTHHFTPEPETFGEEFDASLLDKIPVFTGSIGSEAPLELDSFNDESLDGKKMAVSTLPQSIYVAICDYSELIACCASSLSCVPGTSRSRYRFKSRWRTRRRLRRHRN